MSSGLKSRVRMTAALLAMQALFAWMPAFSSPFQGKKNSRSQNPPERDRFLNGAPFSFEQLVGILDVHPDRLAAALKNRGISFEANPSNLAALKKAGASNELINLIRRIAAPPPSTPVVAKSVTGSLIVKCAPVECSIRLDGKTLGTTQKGVLALAHLPVKKVAIDFDKEGYVGQQKIVAIVEGTEASAEAVLEPTSATMEQFGARTLAKAIEALGGQAGLQDTESISAAGAVVLWNKAGKRSDWSLRALLKSPDMVLFDLDAPNMSGWLSWVADEYKSGGNAKKIAELADFSSAIRVFREFQLARLLNRISQAEFQVSAASPDPDPAGELHLTAAGKIGVYDFTIASDGLPVQVKYESKLGLGSGTQTAYSGYASVGKGKYPSILVIKLADAPQHGMELRFEKISPEPKLEAKDFKAYKPRRRGQ